MAVSFTYTKAHDLDALHDALIAAGLRPTYIADKPGVANGFDLTFADGTSQAAVDAVVDAHDPAPIVAERLAAKAQEQDDRSAIKAAIAVLVADAARLEDTGQAMTSQVVRNHLARTDKILAALCRFIARRM
jgi:hypothetical protein